MDDSRMAIHTRNLTRDFGSLRAVNGLDLDVPRGLVFGLLGPNGSGKTTTLRLLLGLLEPTHGQAEVLGYDTSSQSDAVRENVGALLERTGLYERLTAHDNLEFYGRIWRMPDRARAERIRELLAHFGLWERRHDRVGEWSRGMRQKLAVARAILHHPPLVFLDEPTAGLDPVSAAALRDDLSTLAAREGVTVVMTTHNLTEAEKLCARVGILSRGRLRAAGTMSELRSRRRGSEVRITGNNFTESQLEMARGLAGVTAAEIRDGCLSISMNDGCEVAPLITDLVKSGVQIEEVKKSGANLEELFFELIGEETR